MQRWTRKERYSHRHTLATMVAAGVVGLGAALASPLPARADSPRDTLNNNQRTGQVETVTMRKEENEEDAR